MSQSELEAAAQRLADAGRSLPQRLLNGRGRLFCYWEWRAHAGGACGKEPTISLDGGVRVERHSPSSARVEGWRFLVGAEPGDLGLLCGRAGGGGEARLVAAAMERAFLDLLGQGAESSTGLEEYAQAARVKAAETLDLEFSAWARARAWCFVGGSPKSTWESGVQYCARPQGGGEVFEWNGASPEDAPWRRGQDRQDSSSRGFWSPELSPGAGKPSGSLPQDYEGPVLLLAPASSWWVHEMAHAAFEAESGGGLPGGGGARIIEEPAAGSWPSGFASDDRGHPAARSVLWDENGVHPPSAAGHFRRASVRAPARPSLSVTLLEVEAPAGLGSVRLPSNVPVISAARAGRFDPLNRELFLDVQVAMRPPGSPSAAQHERRVLRMDADKAWQNMVVIADGLGAPLVAASCARQGFVNAVMVGAPTIGLDCVRLSRTYASETKGLGR